jgi:hypothetical protein
MIPFRRIRVAKCGSVVLAIVVGVDVKPDEFRLGKEVLGRLVRLHVVNVP